MSTNSKPDGCLLVIFGASGDLTRRKLIPAMYDLYCDGQLPEGFAVVGISRSQMSDEQYREKLLEFAKTSAAKFEPNSWGKFTEKVHYHAADSTKSEDFEHINRRLSELAQFYHTGENLLMYLSLAPQLYEPTINAIGASGLITEGRQFCSLDRENPPWQRIIIEKPFGTDPQSAAYLNRVVASVFDEDSTYRIDHYLGKETVQNLMVFRFANTIFEPIWNRNFIDHVQVTAVETVGVEQRGSYYDSPGGGAMRDMIQSHLLEVLAVAAMEPPVTMRAEDVRKEKAKILAAARTPAANEIAQLAVRGQYGPGQIGGEALPGFRDESGVAPESQTDTYAAMQVFIDTWRWEGVPFYVRTGKRMSKKLTEVVITFKRTPHCLFADTARALKPNQIVINVQPDEGIRLRFEGKVPGSSMKIKDVIMDFDYVQQFQTKPPEAYATLILDAMEGDQTLYKHREEIEHCWRIVQPVLDDWSEQSQDNLPNYAAGTWGPSTSDIMLAREGRQWHNP